MLATGCGATESTSSPATTVSTTPASSDAATTAPAKKPEPVKPFGRTVNTHKVGWEKASAKGRTVRLTWWSGVAPCSVLDHVKVTETGRKVTLTIYEGTAPKAKNASCIMIAVQKTTVVKLKHALGHRKLVDGAKSK